MSWCCYRTACAATRPLTSRITCRLRRTSEDRLAMAENLRKVFFNELRSESRVAREPVHRTFIKWYVRTRFGPDVKCEVTDGPSDGGIDAIVTESRLKGKAIYIIQSKFYDAFETGRNTPLSIAHYQQFDAMPSVFREDDHFEDWLGTVANDLKPKYRELRHRLNGHDTARSWQLITLHGRSRAGEDRLQTLGADNCI